MDASYKLPDSILYGSPVYIHSHAYTFYHQLSLQTAAQTQAMKDLTGVQQGVTKVLRDNIKILRQVHDAYAGAGIDLSLMDLNNSFLEFKKLKKETLTKYTVQHKTHYYRQLMGENIDKVLDKWVGGPFTDELSDEIATAIANSIGESITQASNNYVVKNNSGGWTSTAELRKLLRNWNTWSSKPGKHKNSKEYIIKKATEKFLKAKTLDSLNLFSVLEKMSVTQRKADIDKYQNDLIQFFNDPVWTTSNAQAKIATIQNIYNSAIGNDPTGKTLFTKGVPQKIGGLLGHLFEWNLVAEIDKHRQEILNYTTNVNGVTIQRPDIVSQALQTAGITTDLDIGILLQSVPNYSYGITAKTSVGGMKFKTSWDAFNGMSDQAWKLLFYILLNYHALSRFEATDKNLSLTFDGGNLIESLAQAIYIVQAAGELLGQCFIETDTTKNTLLNLTTQHQPLSLPIILTFPNKSIYTVDLLETVFDNFVEQGTAAFNQKYLNSISLESIWNVKQNLLSSLAGTDLDNGKLYQTFYDSLKSGYLVEYPGKPGKNNNWFNFSMVYNSNWLETKTD